MNVVHIARNSGGGAGRAVLRLNESLIKNGINSAIVFCDKDDAVGSNIYALGKGSIVHRILCYLEKKFVEKVRVLTDFPYMTGLLGQHVSDLEIVREADIIHLHWICGAISNKEIQRLSKLNKPIVWTFHDIWPMTGGCHVYWNGCTKFNDACYSCQFLKENNKLVNFIFYEKKKHYKNCNINIICPSRWGADMAGRSYLFKNFPIAIIPNALDDTWIEQCRRAHGESNLEDKISEIDSDRINIVFVATSTALPFKGFQYFEQVLLKLFSKEPEICQNITLHIIGENVADSGILGKYDYVYWGFIKDDNIMIKLLNRMDFEINPSLADMFPYVCLEALACGVPVLTFNTGGIPEIVEHKKSGYVAGYADADDLYAGLLWLLRGADLQSIGKYAKKEVAEKYSPNDIATKHIIYYKQLLCAESFDDN